MISVPSLLVFLFPLAYSPGPGNLFFAASGARLGFKATIPATLGYHAATLVVSLVLGLGFGASVTQYPQALTGLRIAGGLYVLRLAWQLVRSEAPGVIDATAGELGGRAGALLLLLNPKAYVIIALMFTQFLPADAHVGNVVLVAGVFTANNLLAFSIWTALGDSMMRRFRSPVSARRLNVGLGAALAVVGCWLLVP